eukprot:2613307-Prymnesium_polylepis.1
MRQEAGAKRTLFSANIKAMSNEPGPPSDLSLCALRGMQLRAAELSAACTIIVSMPPTKLQSYELLAQCVHTIRRCKA